MNNAPVVIHIGPCETRQAAKDLIGHIEAALHPSPAVLFRIADVFRSEEDISKFMGVIEYDLRSVA